MRLLSNREMKCMRFPIPPDIFWDELEDDIPTPVLQWEHYRFCQETHPRELWDKFGCEKLNVEQCETFASYLADALFNMHALPLVACRYRLRAATWFPPKPMPSRWQKHLPKDKEAQALRKTASTYLTQIMPQTFKGAIRLDAHEELKRFLTAMIAYPTAYNYLEPYLLSAGVPLAIHINHHADIFIYFQPSQRSVLGEMGLSPTIIKCEEDRAHP